jgi:hypothetical protein
MATGFDAIQVKTAFQSKMNSEFKDLAKQGICLVKESAVFADKQNRFDKKQIVRTDANDQPISEPPGPGYYHTEVQWIKPSGQSASDSTNTSTRQL